MELIKQDNFLSEIEPFVRISDNQHVIVKLQHLLQIDQKYPEVYQVKLIENLMLEVLERYKKELLDKKTLEEFYQPGDEDEDEEHELVEASSEKKRKSQKAQEVLNFE